MSQRKYSSNNIQQDFEENLKIQLESISKIQDHQTELYSNLEGLGASKDISSEAVQKQINEIFKNVEIAFENSPLTIT
jgi:hypothetical protein